MNTAFFFFFLIKVKIVPQPHTCFHPQEPLPHASYNIPTQPQPQTHTPDPRVLWFPLLPVTLMLYKFVCEIWRLHKIHTDSYRGFPHCSLAYRGSTPRLVGGWLVRMLKSTIYVFTGVVRRRGGLFIVYRFSSSTDREQVSLEEVQNLAHSPTHMLCLFTSVILFLTEILNRRHTG